MSDFLTAKNPATNSKALTKDIFTLPKRAKIFLVVISALALIALCGVFALDALIGGGVA